MNNKGLSAIPIVVGLLLSVILIAALVSVVVTKNSERKKMAHLEAAHLSDLGFQNIMGSITGMEALTMSTFSSIPKVSTEQGSYQVTVSKKMEGNLLDVQIESVGIVEDVSVIQKKIFSFNRQINGTDTIWTPLLKE